MTLTLDEDEILSAAIAGVSKVAELIATVPAEERTRALEAAEKSYLETAHNLGYQDADAQQWASALMSRLVPVVSANNPFAKCSATNLVADASKLEYDIVCPERGAARGHAVYELSSNAFTGRIAASMLAGRFCFHLPRVVQNAKTMFRHRCRYPVIGVDTP